MDGPRPLSTKIAHYSDSVCFRGGAVVAVFRDNPVGQEPLALRLSRRALGAYEPSSGLRLLLKSNSASANLEAVVDPRRSGAGLGHVIRRRLLGTDPGIRKASASHPLGSNGLGPRFRTRGDFPGKDLPRFESGVPTEKNASEIPLRERRKQASNGKKRQGGRSALPEVPGAVATVSSGRQDP
jgi:hypothetical protein